MKLASIFQDGVILQANKTIYIFGYSVGDVTVGFNGLSVKATPQNGKWIASFPKMPYGGPYTLTVNGDEETIELKDVYVGEVILFSGQSNIQFHMWEEVTPKEQYVNDDKLRIYMCDRIEEGEHIFSEDGWVKASKENIDDWAALPYLVGRELRNKGVPAVGVVACSQGASKIQAWMDDVLINGTKLDLPADLITDGHNHLYNHWNVNGRLYHIMLEPMIPFAFGGVVWYQGESNTSDCESEIYPEMLKILITDWRKKFKNDNLDFYVIQLTDLNYTEPWKRVQKAQEDIQNQLDNVKTVISADICEKEEIHPPTKWKLAKRITESYMLTNGIK